MSLASQAAVQSDVLQPGEVLQETYSILHKLGSGGMGEVYVARHERLQTMVAVKALGRHLAEDAAARARFEREAGVLSQVKHPHVVQIFDFNVSPQGIPYLVMELLEGPTLADYAAQQGSLTPETVVRLVRQTAGALEAVHSQGLVHRDLKPENLIVLHPPGQEEFVKLLDFGICKAPSSELTTTSSVLGTPEFMSPEQAKGEPLDGRSDQFALAAMAYMLLSGRKPFSGEHPVSVLFQIVHEPAPLLRVVAPNLNPRAQAVFDRALAKAAGDRYAGVLGFAEALADALLVKTIPVPPLAPVPSEFPDIELSPVEQGPKSGDCGG